MSVSCAPAATRQRFVRWLAGQAEDAVVGEYAQCHTCVLAQFLLSLEPDCMPHVDQGGWTRWESEERHRPLPAWGRQVMRVADSATLVLHYGQVTAGVLRAALERELGWVFPPAGKVA